MIRALLMAALLIATPALAQQAPTAQAPAPIPFNDRGQLSAAELELQAALKGERISGRVSIPDAAAANLIQPEGRDWRAFHNRTLTWIGGIALVGMLCVLGGFFFYRGRIRIDSGPSGHTLERFTLLERANHWMVASSFIVLGLTGLNLTFGRFLLLPIVGPEAFTAISQIGKYAHNYLAFPFTLGIVLMFILWVKDNIPERADIDWVKKAGGLFGHEHPGAGRFNAGQKTVFWLTVLGGGLVAASGYVLIFPFAMTDIAGQQLAYIIHGVLALLMFAAMLAHIYIGSVGMEGAFDAMGSGQVDLNWAREHHDRWVDEQVTKAKAHMAPPGAKAAGAD
jgi:formate dehydrogenase subunit gamma